MSRFVAAGATDEPSKEDDEWAEAQRKIDATRQPKPRLGEQEDGKSLYDTLQANKAAKQDAFEEAARLSNQFQSLNEDEAAFLDSVLESTRNKEAQVKKDTREQLEAFRRQQEDAERATRQEDALEEPVAAESWSIGPRKRKKGRGTEGIGGVKLRKASTTDGDEKAKRDDTQRKDTVIEGRSQKGSIASPTSEAKPLASLPLPSKEDTTSEPQQKEQQKSSLGLVAYSSDEDG